MIAFRNIRLFACRVSHLSDFIVDDQKKKKSQKPELPMLDMYVLLFYSADFSFFRCENKKHKE